MPNTIVYYMPLYAVQTTKSHEQTSAELIATKAPDKVYAAISPDEMISYVIVEAEDINDVEKAISEVPHARKVLEDETSIAEIEQFLTPTSDVEGFNEGDIVELTGGPFQGDKAKISSVEASSERVTVELIEATVPIPVEVRGDKIRVLDKEEWD